MLTVDEREHLVYEMINAIDYLRKDKIGALMVIERDISLGNYIDKAKKLYADLSSDLLISIFYEGNPLHDGGVIIQGDKLTCAGAVFKTSMNPNVNKNLKRFMKKNGDSELGTADRLARMRGINNPEDLFKKNKSAIIIP